MSNTSKNFGWLVRLRYGLLAALIGWVAGWAVCFPFELIIARRYVLSYGAPLLVTLAKGLLVWAGFSGFMAAAGFVPIMLPWLVLISPRWLVRWRRLLIVATPLLAAAAIYRRMGMLHLYFLHHTEAVRSFFFTAPNIFVVTFALVVVWVYTTLAERRLAADRPRPLDLV